jgi:predicted lipoprotein with Yx(FWY)xxD motif
MENQGERGASTHLEGLRAWLGEVDRALRVRSRVGLALLLIASGVGGAALYLAIDASQNSAPASDIQSLQEQIGALRAQQTRADRLAARISVARLLEDKTSAELTKLQAQVRGLRQQANAHSGRTSIRHLGSASPQTGGKGSTPSKVKNSSASGASVSVASNPKVGQILVNSQGLTLYDFHKDKGGKSACYGACAKIWPPLTTTGPPHGTSGVEASKLGTSSRTDGTTQVTYGGHPLYSYVGDKKPGEAAGNGITEFGGSWHALHPNGKEAGG